MIKQIEFATRRSGVTPREFETACRKAASVGVDAPLTARPRRIALCLAVPNVEAQHDAVILRWFDDPAQLERFEEWRAPATEPTTVVVAEEVVARGAEWLDRRWREGGEQFKHMAIARRAAGLTPAEFSERWRGRAGTVKKAGEATVTVIPDEARGLAYVQNHPVARLEGEWAYDAVNEVYFDDLDSLRTRVDWFAANLGEAAEADLIGQNWFLCCREEVLLAGP